MIAVCFIKCAEVDKSIIDLNRVVCRTATTGRSVESTQCQLGDYFDSIVFEDSVIRFYIKQDVSSYWKNLVVNVLGLIGHGFVKSIRLEVP